MAAQYITKAILVLTKAIAEQHRQIIAQSPAQPPERRQRLGINYGILLAHQTTLESPLSEEGLSIRTLEAIAEDILDIMPPAQPPEPEHQS